MEKLKGSTYNSIQQELSSSDEERWRNVNISMKPNLVQRLDFFVESDQVQFNSRSRLVREILKHRLNILEQEYDGDAV